MDSTIIAAITNIFVGILAALLPVLGLKARWKNVVFSFAAILFLVGLVFLCIWLRSIFPKDSLSAGSRTKGDVSDTKGNEDPNIPSDSQKQSAMKDDIEKSKQIEINDLILNKGIKNEPATKEIIVSVADGDSAFDSSIGNLLSSKMNEKHYRSTASFFSNKIFSNAFFDRLQTCDNTLIRELNLFDYADYLLIGHYTKEFSSSNVLKGRRVATIAFSITKINLSTPGIEYTVRDKAVGNGPTDERALEDAQVVFSSMLSQKIN